MEPAKTRGRVIGFVLAAIVLVAAVWFVIYQMHGPGGAKVIVIDTGASGAGLGSGAIVQPLVGVIISADGKPVGNAEVLLGTAGNYIDVYNLARRAGPAVRSDKDGRFGFAETPTWTDLVVRCPQGYGYVKAGEMPAQGRIVIQPWGRVEGVFRPGGKPQGDQPIVLYGQSIARAIATTNPNNPIQYVGGVGRLMLSQMVRTDENGHYVFPRVVPGNVVLARQTSTAQGQVGRTYTVATFAVAPGETIQSDIGGKGRPVIGRLVLDEKDEQLAISGSIELVRDPQARMGLSIPQNWASLSDQERTKIVEEWTRRSRQIPFSTPVIVAADGTFRADDIPAGQHQLSVSSQVLEPSEGRMEILADGTLTFTMPEIPGGRSDEALDVGNVNVRVRPRVKIGSAAPAIEAVKADKGVVRLSDYRGKYVLLNFVFDYGTMQQPDRAQLERMAGIIQGRFGEGQLGMLTVTFPQRPGGADYTVPSIAGWTVGAMEDWRQRLPAAYTKSPSSYLIDPEGKIASKFVLYGNSGYGLLDRTLGTMRGNAAGVSVVVEKLLGGDATTAFEFKTIPTISKDDAGQDATFTIVDGRKANFGGELRVLNDGLGPRHDKDEALMLTFYPGTVEGRIKSDLGKVFEIDQINTYAWYKDSHRWAQVYRVYGSDGEAKGFNPEPKIGTNPATCGWSLIASVDTREAPGGTELKDDIKGQSGVSIRNEAGAIGKYRYLLFVTFATETRNIYGQTFWTEIDIVGR